MKTPIECKKGWKAVLFIIWTGIFVLSSCIIVKGSGRICAEWKESVEEYLTDIQKELAVRLLLKESVLFEYGAEEIQNSTQQRRKLLFGWNLAEYLEEIAAESEMADAAEAAAGKKLLQQDALQKDFPFVAGEVYYEDETTENAGEEDGKEAMALAEGKVKKLKETFDTDYLLKNFYIVDSTTSVDASLFQVEKLLKKDMSVEKKEEPQILIYHTHGATEGFTDSVTGKEVSVIEVGEKLSSILEEKYGYAVIHDDTPYDMVDGKIDRNKAYNQSLEGIKKALKKHPSIEVIIDLHRDGIGSEDKRTTVIHGKNTAKFMLFNGLSRNKEGAITYLENSNLEGNLAFSLQMKLKAMELYPTLTRPNYLKGYRYNLHLREKSLLIELGNQNNSVQEAMNALEPMAEILAAVLSGK